MKLTYAVHAYAWTSRWTNADLPLVDHVARLGFDALEIPLMDLDLVDPLALRERADAAGIGLLTSTVCGPHTDPSSPDLAIRTAALDYLCACVDATADMGASIFTGVTYSVHGGRIEGKPEDAHYERAAEVLASACRHAEERGVRVGIEPCNRYETFLVNTGAQAVALAERVGAPNLGVHLDTYHMNMEEDDFAEPVRLAGERLLHVHLSESHRGIPGRGTVDWRAFYEALSALDYEGYVGLESFVEMAPSMKAATCVWRDLASSSDELVTEGLAYLRALERDVAAP